MGLADMGILIEEEYAGYWDPAGEPLVFSGVTYYYHPSFVSVATLRAATEAVFTPAVAQEFFDSAFADPPLFVDFQGKLYRADVGGWGGLSPAYPSTIEITSQTEETITFVATVPAETGEDYLSDFTLRKVKGHWRLDCLVNGVPR